MLQDAKLDIAYKQLGLTRDAVEDDVKSAFRKLARECHPDVSHLPKEEAEHRFRTIIEAYTYIRTTNGW
ncbi:MAG: DnaJ domain-containing protein [Anaerolineae bacterium]|nr:DnaJ domain-containing protein [Anaerolineae bacterium]